jgi:hypothetical protein
MHDITLGGEAGLRERAPDPPDCADVGWSAFKLVVAPVCAFCAVAAGRWGYGSLVC